MSISILIDANIYLGLYRAKPPRSVLDSISRLDHVFVSEQIVDEVTRNRVRIAATAFAENIGNIKSAKSIPLPDADESEVEMAAVVTNEVQKFNSAAKALKQGYAQAMLKLLRSIQKGTDPVSVVLRPLFLRAVSATHGELTKARRRRERGLPPGKPGDPLGDQLIWEQFLTRCAGVDNIVIVSRDRDYVERHLDELFLNPILERDIRNTAFGAAVTVFDTLADALPFVLARIRAPVPIPAAEALAMMKQQEQVVLPVPMEAPARCPRCTSNEGFIGPIPTRGTGGRWSSAFVCVACGARATVEE